MITGVRLKNWRSHLNSELSFTKGTNALLGHMGSGKTSILDSICFSFFGTFPNLQSRKLKLDDLVMNKPSVKNLAEVETFFRSGERDYSVKRIIEKGKGTTYSEIRENGKLLEAPSTQRVNEIIAKILKVDYELFSKAIYSEQNALDYFLTIPKGQRMKKIDELLMIDKFEKARSNSVSLTNKIMERKSAKQSMVDRINVKEVEATIKNLRSSLEEIIGEKVKFERDAEQASRERKNAENSLRNLYKTRENFEALKREEKGVASAIEEINKTMKKFESELSNIDRDTLRENFSATSKLLNELVLSLEDKRREYQRLMEQYSKSVAETQLHEKEIGKINSEIEKRLKFQKEVEKLKKKIGKNVDAEFDKRKKLIEEFVGKLEAFKIKISNLSDAIDQLSSVKAKCPICEAKLTEEKKIMLTKQKQREMDQIKEDFKKALKQKQITEQDLRDLEYSADKLNELISAIKDLDELKNNLETNRDIFKVLMENTKKYEKELNGIKNTFENVQKKIDEVSDAKKRFEIMLHYLRDYESGKARMEELSRQRNEIMSHVKNIETGFDSNAIYSIETGLRDLVGKERELGAKASSLGGLVAEKEARLKELESVFSSSKSEVEEVKKLGQLIMHLKLFEKSLEATQVQLRQEFIITVNYSMNQIWDTLYPYQDFPEIRLNVEEGDYVLQLKGQNNEWVNVEGIVSGGERSLAALALRIAFSLVLTPQLRWLFLDEPTTNLDSTAVKVLSDTLRERINDFVDQTFLITHTPELGDAVTGYAYRLERDKASDGYTQIVQLN